jgi:hypothetical protein
VAVDQAGHGDGVRGAQDLFRGRSFGGLSYPGDGVSGDGDGAVFEDGFVRVEADDAAAGDQQVYVLVYGIWFFVRW